MAGENVKESLKKNLKLGAKGAVKDVAKIGVKQLKRKLDDALTSPDTPKLKKKNGKKLRKSIKFQTGSGIGGTIFD